MNEHIQRKIREIIGEIQRKSVSANYIYRGEPKTHEGRPYCGKVSSSLWRSYGIEMEEFDIEVVQTELLRGAKEHIGDLPEDYRMNLAASLNLTQEESDKIIDSEILTEIQHYGGQTNLIDFTTDYCIALFFACDGYHNKEGRVILQNTEEIQDIIEHPRNPRHRVIAQKSVFVRPPKGFIDKPHADNLVIIPGDLKQWILQHLHQHYRISKETLYNDVYGFIRYQDIHGDAYTQFYRAYACHNRWAEATSYEERQRENEKSIEYYTRAIKLNPNLFQAYHNRAGLYIRMGRHDRALEDFSKAIDLNPTHVESYSSRAFCRGMGGDYERAIEDCNRAIELDTNNSNAYSTRGIIYELIGDYERAIEDCNRAIELNTNNSSAYNARGITYWQIGDYKRAIEDYTKAIDLDSNFVEAYYNRGETLLHLREWEKAQEDLIAAKNRGYDIISSFRKGHGSVTDFQTKTGIILPPDIADMLTNTQS